VKYVLHDCQPQVKSSKKDVHENEKDAEETEERVVWRTKHI